MKAIYAKLQVHPKSEALAKAHGPDQVGHRRGRTERQRRGARVRERPAEGRLGRRRPHGSIELANGTNPIDPDTDDDGLTDGDDVEFIQNVVLRLPVTAFKPTGGGTRKAILSILNAAESAALAGNVERAINMLVNLRKHLDGCGSLPDADDWIVNCPDQTTVRSLLDLLMSNLATP